MLVSFIDFREEEISITFILVAAIFIGQQVYEGIAVQNNIAKFMKNVATRSLNLT